MADSANPAGPATEAATPAGATNSREVTTPNQQNESGDSLGGGFTKADFDHPEYGSKAKALYKGFQEATTKAKRLEERSGQYETQWKGLAEKVQANDKLRKALWEAYNGSLEESSGKTNPSEASEKPEEDEREQLRKSLREEILGEVKSELALHKTIAQLGAGDLDKGRQAFEKAAPEVHKMLGVMERGGAEDRLGLVMEVLRLRELAKNPPPPPEPEGSTASETGRATSEELEEAFPQDEEAQIAYALRVAGFKDRADYVRAHGGGS